MTETTFPSRLRQLALALLNATLMLAVLLVFGVWLLVGRVQDLATGTVAAAAEKVGTDVQARLVQQARDITDTIENVKGIDGRIDATLAKVQNVDSAAATELKGLRSDVQLLTTTLGGIRTDIAGLRADTAGTLRAAFQQLLIDLADRIGPRPTSD
jgi:hypothetical protein